MLDEPLTALSLWAYLAISGSALVLASAGVVLLVWSRNARNYWDA